jgi:hypothetical protein
MQEVEEVIAETPVAQTYRYRSGTWHDLPRFKCPNCNHAVVDKNPERGVASIDQHIEDRHPSDWLEGV